MAGGGSSSTAASSRGHVFTHPTTPPPFSTTSPPTNPETDPERHRIVRSGPRRGKSFLFGPRTARHALRGGLSVPLREQGWTPNADSERSMGKAQVRSTRRGRRVNQHAVGAPFAGADSQDRRNKYRTLHVSNSSSLDQLTFGLLCRTPRGVTSQPGSHLFAVDNDNQWGSSSRAPALPRTRSGVRYTAVAGRRGSPTARPPKGDGRGERD